MIRIILMREHMNAIDEDDNLVGFSTADDCCAHGGWFVSDKIEEDNNTWEKLEMTTDKEYPDYYFNVDFFKELKDEDAGGAVVFEMVSVETDKRLYLHLFNCHNGYYGKGFSYQFNGKRIAGGL